MDFFVDIGLNAFLLFSRFDIKNKSFRFDVFTNLSEIGGFCISEDGNSTGFKS
jgi:hypothetical protein